VWVFREGFPPCFVLYRSTKNIKTKPPSASGTQNSQADKDLRYRQAWVFREGFPPCFVLYRSTKDIETKPPTAAGLKTPKPIKI